MASQAIPTLSSLGQLPSPFPPQGSSEGIVSRGWLLWEAFAQPAAGEERRKTPAILPARQGRKMCGNSLSRDLLAMEAKESRPRGQAQRKSAGTSAPLPPISQTAQPDPWGALQTGPEASRGCSSGGPPADDPQEPSPLEARDAPSPGPGKVFGICLLLPARARQVVVASDQAAPASIRVKTFGEESSWLPGRARVLSRC